MIVLKRKNKQDLFRDQTPTLFDVYDTNILKIESRSWTSGRMSNIFNLIGRNHYNCDFIINQGTLFRDNYGIVIIIVKDSHDKLTAYYNKQYFDGYPSHKSYANNYVKSLGLSVRKDIVMVEKDLINTWLKPITVDLNFYSINTQNKVTEELFTQELVNDLL